MRYFIFLLTFLCSIKSDAQNELYVNGDNNATTVELFVNDKNGTSSTLFVNGEYKNIQGTVKNNESLIKVTGNFTNTAFTGGEYTSIKGELQLIGASTQTISGDKIDAHYVVLNNAAGAIILSSCNLNIDSALVLSQGTYTANSGSETVLLSNIGGDAYLDDFTGSGSYAGNIIVQRYVNNGTSNDQHFIASPVSTPMAAVLADDLMGPWGSGLPGGNMNSLIPSSNCSPDSLNFASDYGNLFQWEESNVITGCEQEGWVIRSSGTLENARGYSAYLPFLSTADFVGAPNTATVSYSGSVNGTSGNAAVNQWILVGNPYPSPMLWSAPAGIEAIAKLYNVSGPYQGTYSDINPGSVVAIGQGFSVRNAVSGAFTFALDNSDRTVTGATWKSSPSFDYEIQVAVRGNGFADKSSIFFAPNTSLGFDFLNEDGAKRSARAGQPFVYSIVNGEHLSANGMPTASYGQHSIPLGVHPGMDGQYDLVFDGIISLPESSLVFLEDKFLSTFTDLRMNPVYSFSMTSAEDQDRFELHLSPAVELNSNMATCAGSDGKIVLDFGNYSLNGTAIAWNYELSLNGSNLEMGQTAGVKEINELEPGTYNLTYSYGALSFNEQIEIEGLELIAADFSASALRIVEGESVLFSNLSTGANNYEWLIAGTAFNEANLAYTFFEAGQYEVTLIASNEHCSDALSVSISVSNKLTGLNEIIDLNTILIYYNGNEIVVDLSAANLKETASIEVFDFIGQLVVNQIKASNNEVLLNVDHLSDGFYLVRVVNAEQEIVKKVPVAK
jgi:hypothetical protein